MHDLDNQLFEHIEFIYGEEVAPRTHSKIMEAMLDFDINFQKLKVDKSEEKCDERDTILITYGDMVKEPDVSPLHTLAEFLEEYVGDIISTVHILPFYPYSSDDGFSVIDYREVSPSLGTWQTQTMSCSSRIAMGASTWIQNATRNRSQAMRPCSPGSRQSRNSWAAHWAICATRCCTESSHETTAADNTDCRLGSAPLERYLHPRPGWGPRHLGHESL